MSRLTTKYDSVQTKLSDQIELDNVWIKYANETLAVES
jgi:hypothetical protein